MYIKCFIYQVLGFLPWKHFTVHKLKSPPASIVWQAAPGTGATRTRRIGGRRTQYSQATFMDLYTSVTDSQWGPAIKMGGKKAALKLASGSDSLLSLVSTQRLDKEVLEFRLHWLLSCSHWLKQDFCNTK